MIMQASEDITRETDELDSCFEEENALSESGFHGDLLCKYTYRSFKHVIYFAMVQLIC